MIKLYESVFNRKIDYFHLHPKYQSLRKSADDALRYHTGYGLDAIRAADFMDRIIKMPLPYIEAWLNGENALTWRDMKTGKNYDAEHISDALNRQMGDIQ